MYIGDEAGSSDVPEPIALIEITFVWLAPTRIPISSPFIINSAPIFIVGVPPIVIAGIWDMGLGDGLAEGIGMFIPGRFICGRGEAPGDAAGIGVFM